MSRCAAVTCFAPPLVYGPETGKRSLDLSSAAPSSAASLSAWRCPCSAAKPRTRIEADARWRSRTLPVLASNKGAEVEEASESRCLLHARSGEDLLSYLWKESEKGRLPLSIATELEELYYNYQLAVLQSGHPDAKQIILSSMAVVFDRIVFDVYDPFSFSPHHRAIRKPFDYYMLGQNYIHPLIDYRNSYIGNLSLFYDMEEKLRQGHNIVLMSNHQTEADPAIIALLLERTNSYIAETMLFVAGDRVIKDPLCKPFSMGRNLLCVFSKKHMYDIPELAEMKRISNTRSMKEMAMLLRSGSQLIWIAPSGGRDRPDAITGELSPAPFDAASVDNMRRLVEHSSIPGHIYPLALRCYEIMPPPPQVANQIGEQRTISFQGVGISVGPEITYNEIASNCKNGEESKEIFSQTIYKSVIEQYDVLQYAIHGNQGFEASNSNVSLSQPWL